jgi:hypothetical protein
MMNKPRRAAATSGLDWLRASTERTLLVLARRHAMPPEVACYAVELLPTIAKTGGFVWLDTGDLQHAEEARMDVASSAPLLVIDGLHAPLGPHGVDCAGWLLEHRHHLGLRSVVSTCLAPDEIGPWFEAQGYLAVPSLLGRLQHGPTSLVIDILAPRLAA